MPLFLQFRIGLIACLVGCGLFPMDLSAQTLAEHPAVGVESGQLRGLTSDETIEFRGIPYAEPPVGEHRFAPPTPVTPWSGIRKAQDFASPCPQGETFEEDCLYLNIIAPRDAAGAKRPVMVWLHGGGFSTGTANTYSAIELAEQGVIVVTIEFRLNIFGLLALKGMPGSGSLIFQDQQAALSWIQRNIAAFGGDPQNVTLFGESGGAIGICAQLASPSARGLFHKAILQSGSCSTSFEADFVARGVPAGRYFTPLATMEAQSLALAETLGCTAGEGEIILSCLHSLPADAIAKAGAAFYSASYGTPTIPSEPAAALTQGGISNVPVLTGFNQNEGLAMVAGMQLIGAPVTPDEYPGLLEKGFGPRASEVAARYPLDRFDGRGDLAWAAVITDRMFACPQLHDAVKLSRSNPVYAYEFADPDGVGLIPTPPGLPRGPSHTSELPLLFRMTDGPLDISTGQRIERTADQQELSARMIAAWAEFAKTGRPGSAENWPKFEASEGRVAWLGPRDTSSPTQPASVRHQCAFWTTFRAE